MIFGLRIFICLRGRESSTIGVTGHPRYTAIAELVKITAIMYLGFLVYAIGRAMTTDVLMDAERNVLLFLTPALIGIQIIYGLHRKMIRTLFILVLINLSLIGLYGIVNHFITGSEFVLWAKGFPQYWRQGRASGPLFCPDHFAGALELSLAMAMGLLLDRGKKMPWKLLASVVCVISLTGIVMSKSRGAGLTVLVMIISAATFGFAQWPIVTRWKLRGILLASVVAIIAGLFLMPKLYTERFTGYFKVKETENPTHIAVIEKLKNTTRGKMYTAAIRAWRKEPFFGIGPGMHRNIWPYIAATPDGDRKLGIRPTHTNTHMHSYHVHSDWLQLLEEYGIIGFILFTLPAAGVFIIYLMAIKKEAERFTVIESRNNRESYFAVSSAGLLAFIAMTFHSLGDFNLQIPAVNWLFSCVACIPLGLILGRRNLPGKNSV